ncbi:hypothetical protein DPMN_111447 [Dreissena polymorpha]|uniref:Uncharacterized protein n=1 Tax=Dreissena polymorpha TaxID=45954 RepID=A0A9D4KDV6_DREPO|nr:hypothetical protein DPMN_111447 [Dreissena polymorpha]
MVVPFVANLIDELAPVTNLAHPPWRLAVECAVCYSKPDLSGFQFCDFVLFVFFHRAFCNPCIARLHSKNLQLVVRNVPVPSPLVSRQQNCVPRCGLVKCPKPEVRILCQVRTSFA